MCIRSSNVFIEPVFSGVVDTFYLPLGEIEYLSRVVNHSGGKFSFNLVDTYIREWGATLDQKSNITFVNSVNSYLPDLDILIIRLTKL